MVRSPNSLPLNKRPAYRFTPRKDLFPAPEPIPANNPTKPVTEPSSSQNDAVLSRLQKTLRKTGGPALQPVNLLLILIVFKALSSLFQPEKKTGIAMLGQSLGGFMEHPNIMGLLNDISPYLNEREQDGVFTILGMMDAYNIIKGIRNRTYHQQKKAVVSSAAFKNPKTKKIGILNAVKPYLPKPDNEMLEKMVQIYEASDKVMQNIQIIRNNRNLSENQDQKGTENITEMLKAFKPIFPPEHQTKLDSISKVLTMAEVMNLMDMKNTSSDTGNNVKKPESYNKTGSTEGRDEDASQGKSGIGSMGDTVESLKSVMNDDQKKALNMFMKMAELLAAPSESEEKE